MEIPEPTNTRGERNKPYPVDPEAGIIQLIQDAKLWIHAADLFLNNDIDVVHAYGEDPADLEDYYAHTREGANVLNFLRQRINSGDVFIVRLIAELQRSALRSEAPEAVRQQQFDDLERLLNEFRKNT